jgi:hypothetical protein
MSNRPWTKYWIKHFQSNLQYGSKRFKRLDTRYPPFDIDGSLIDNVERDHFIKIEAGRIPLFIGSQFGLVPDIIRKREFFNGKKQIAVLNQSLLSGFVSGLTIYQIEENEQTFNYNQVIHFENVA